MSDDKNMQLPEGLGFSLAMNLEAMQNFSNLSEDEKKKVIAQSREVESKSEMSQLVDRIATNSFQG